MAEVAAAHPGAAIEVWCQDEARRGLQPIRRRVWAPKGQRPVAVGTPRYAWAYVYGFAHPASGRTDWWLLPVVDVAAMGQVLAAFAADAGAGPTTRVILVLDNAGWHTSPRLAIPEGLHLVFLPPYTPELQPAERLWPLLNAGLANRDHADLAALDDAVATRCRQLTAQPAAIQRATGYHWWPADQPGLS